jgi:hypothetical protein
MGCIVSAYTTQTYFFRFCNFFIIIDLLPMFSHRIWIFQQRKENLSVSVYLHGAFLLALYCSIRLFLLQLENDLISY